MQACWVSPFVQDKKKLGFGLGGERLSRYDIRADGALPPSITVIARVKMWATVCILSIINSKIEICPFEFF